MPRSVKVLLWSCLSLVSVVVLAVVFVAVFDWNYARPWVSRQASELAGRPVAINGDLDVEWSRHGEQPGWGRWVPWPQVTARDIVVGSPWEGDDKEMAKVSRLSVVLNPLPLLNHTVELNSLDIEEADVLLERRDDGQANWTLAKKEQDSEPSKWRFDLQKISLKRVRAQAIDAASKLDVKAELDTLQDGGSQGYGLGWKASGTYNDAEIGGEGKTGGILSLRQGSDPFPLSGKVSIGGTTIELEGSVTRPQNLASLDVRLKLAGPTMSDLLPLIGVALPHTPPYSTEGRLVAMLEGDDDRWRYEDFKGKMGESDLEGTLIYQVREPRSLLTGEVESRLLRFQDLGPLVGADTSDVKSDDSKKQKRQQPADKALPVASINTDAWGVMDADVKFHGRKILRDKDLPLDNIEAHVKLEDKVLSLAPLNFGVAGGTLGNTIKLDGKSEKIKAELKTEARHLKLKRLFPGAESMNASFGELHGDAELSATGSSIAELLGHSNGELKALVSRGTISHFLLEAAGLNVANMIIVKLFGDEQIVLDCLASDFSVKNGVMDARAFRLETDDVVVDITGQINLATERLDLDIRPANKTVRVFTLRSPLYAKGTFKNPDVGVQTGPLLARAGAAVALGVLATPFAALLPLLNVGTDDAGGCGSLLAQAKKDPKAPPPGETAAQKNGATAADAKQNGKSENGKAQNGKAQSGRSEDQSKRENWPSNQPSP